MQDSIEKIQFGDITLIKSNNCYLVYKYMFDLNSNTWLWVEIDEVETITEGFNYKNDKIILTSDMIEEGIKYILIEQEG